ncbi:MAG: membrane integrity-associated transporter subunit PqiC [Gammaproteobacteria bacterium]|nr:membrane integrity-associated transporter subunit PqiC [Gammaproteobacteria bacterium]
MRQCHASLGRSVATALLLALGLSGCLGKGGTKTHYYLVDPVPFTAADAPAQPLAVEIMDLHVPQYLERFQIATRTGENGVVYAEYHQWGESLRKNLLRTLALNLSGLLGVSDVSTPLNRSLAPPDFRIHVHIDRFEQDVDGVVRLKARWQILNTRTPDARPATDALELESDGAPADRDYVAVVAAMTEVYGRLAQRIASGIVGDAQPEPGQ